MEVAAYIFAALAAACAILISVFAMFLHWRDAVIWVGCTGLCCLVITGTCWFQDREWKRSATTAEPRGGENDSIHQELKELRGDVLKAIDTSRASGLG